MSNEDNNLNPGTFKTIGRISLQLAVTGAVFAVDLQLPLGWSVWIAYFILLPTIWRRDRRQIVAWSVVWSGLIVVKFLVPPPDSDWGAGILDRTTGVTLLWVLTATTLSRQRAEQAVYEHKERLRAVLNTATDAIVVINEHGLIDSINPATETMFGYSAAELIGRNVKLLMSRPYGDEQDSDFRRDLETGQAGIIGNGREVSARRKDGSVFPVDLAVSEIKHLGLFTGILRDVSERKHLQREILEIAAAEQRRIGQELHDGTQQELTALGLMAGSVVDLVNSVAEQTGAGQSVWPFDELRHSRLSEASRYLYRHLSEAAQHVQQLARGIMPVQIDADGLCSALTELATSTDGLNGTTCRFDCPVPITIANNTKATHLYRIAQEAVNNALRHGRASEIVISLARTNGELRLGVHDNGSGFDAASAVKSARNGGTDGMGLRIMEYRAGMIGGTLRVERGETGGTTVRCRVLHGGGVHSE